MTLSIIKKEKQKSKYVYKKLLHLDLRSTLTSKWKFIESQDISVSISKQNYTQNNWRVSICITNILF